MDCTRAHSPHRPPKPINELYSVRLYLEARYKSPLEIVDEVLAEQIRVVAKVRRLVEKLHQLGQPLIPGINEKYEANAARANQYNVDPTSRYTAFVQGTSSMQNRRHRVDLQEADCSCHMWELLGIPCAHAIAAAKVRPCINSLYCST